MFDPHELKQLEKLFNQSEERMVGKIGESEERMVGEIGAVEERITGLMGTSIQESESRMTGRIESAIQRSEKKIGLKLEQLSNDIAEMVDNTILPMIAEKADKSDIERLERKLDRVIDKVSEHDLEINKIKSQVIVS